jgi:hypothetical protein
MLSLFSTLLYERVIGQVCGLAKSLANRIRLRNGTGKYRRCVLCCLFGFKVSSAG